MSDETPGAEPTSTRVADNSISWANVLAITKRTLQDLRRSGNIWSLSGGIVLSILLPLLFQLWLDGTSVTGALGSISVMFLVLVPIMIVVTASDAIAGDRDAGSLRYLLGLPVTRAEVVLGTIFGWLGAVAGTTLATVAVALPLAVVTLDGIDVDGAVTLFAGCWLLALCAAAYVTIVVGISAASQTGRRASIGAVGFYFVANVLWGIMIAANGLRRLFARLGISPPESIYAHLHALSPTAAAVNSLFFLLPAGGSSGDLVDPPIAVCILLIWTIGAPTLGYLRFRTADIQ